MRRRILLLVVGMTTLVVLAFAIPLAILIRSNAYNNGVKNLQYEATEIARYLRAYNSTRTSTEITTFLKRYTDDQYASVQLPSGRTLGRTPPGGIADAPAPSTQSHQAPRASAGPSGSAGSGQGGSNGQGGSGQSGSNGQDGLGGYGNRGGGPGGFDRDLRAQPFRGGQIVQLRVPTFAYGGYPATSDPDSPAGAYTIRVYADDSALHSGQTAPLALLAGVAVALILIGLLLGELLTRRIVRPLLNTAETAQRLAAGDITARATTSGPVEVADVGRALNRLADRIDELIAEERETVADLSHRLRTPLTALRLDTEALRDPAVAETMGAHVSTLERMLTAVIHAARRPQREGRMPSCNATEVVGERVAFWSALAEDQERTATISLPSEPLPVRAGAEDLAAAVDALMENVIAHTPEGTAYAVSLEPTAAGVRLVVDDDGPGLPPDASVRGRSDRGSSGLGLSIAGRCAESSGGAMTLGASASGGASVTLDFGRP